MLGIWAEKDKADEKFVNFFELIQSAAARENSVFFSWSGEGHEISTDELDGEDMSGWLVGIGDVGEFEPQWTKDRLSIDGKFEDCFCVAEWFDDDGEITVKFRHW